MESVNWKLIDTLCQKVNFLQKKMFKTTEMLQNVVLFDTDLKSKIRIN
jgi:hypothetical protein